VATGGPNPTRLYTRTGDGGETALVGGTRVAKDAPRIRAFGTLDELGATLGFAQGLLPESTEPVRALLLRLQHELFVAQSEVATAPGRSPPAHRIEARHVARLESELDQFSGALDPLHSFVLPRGAGGGAALHVCRTVARRAEREMWELNRLEPQRPELMQWLNRLSDLLFALALTVNRTQGIREIAPDYSV
jgi:cob(I)alamin adenosyltransferase